MTPEIRRNQRPLGPKPWPGRVCGVQRQPRSAFLLSLLAPVLLLGGCATVPSGPRVMALPGSNMGFDQFRADEGSCRMYAQESTGVPPGQAGNQAGVNSAIVGTLLGAGAGALIGAATGSPAAGAAIGGGSGLLLGSMAGADAAALSYGSQQHRYDSAYIQCMYSKGHRVPVPAGYVAREQTAAFPPPPPPNYRGAAPRQGDGAPPARASRRTSRAAPPPPPFGDPPPPPPDA
jgi:hypothetical protein